DGHPPGSRVHDPRGGGGDALGGGRLTTRNRRQDQLVRGRSATGHLPDPGFRLLLHLRRREFARPGAGISGEMSSLYPPATLPGMRKVAGVALLALLAARPGAPDTEVRKAGEKLDVRANGAPVSEVLDRIARETGMKVTYDGAPPRARITVTLTGVTPAQAVLAVLEGQGLNYALRMDPKAVRIETLLMVAGSGSGASTPAPRAQAGPRPIDREPDITEPEEEAPAEAPPAPEERR